MAGARFLFVLLLLFGRTTGGRAVAQAVPVALAMGPAASRDIQQEGLRRGSQSPCASPIIESVLQIISPVPLGTRTTTAYDPATFGVEIVRSVDEDVLAAIDAEHHEPLTILTVTTVDARYNHRNLNTLANAWQSILQSALHQALVIRQPAVQRWSLGEVLRGAAALVVATALLLIVVVRLRRCIEGIEEQLLDNEPAHQTPQVQGRSASVS